MSPCDRPARGRTTCNSEMIHHLAIARSLLRRSFISFRPGWQRLEVRPAIVLRAPTYIMYGPVIGDLR
jgi:hypothetical protein